MSTLRRPVVRHGWIAAAALAVAALSPTVAPATPSDASTAGPMPVVAFIGDSYAGGSHMGGNGAAGWPAIVSHDEGWTPMNVAVGGSGYTRTGSGTTTYGQRVAAVAARKPQGVVFAGSLNDRWSTPAQVYQAALAALRDERRELPQARLLVIGPFCPGSPSAAQLEIRDAVERAALAVRADWVDPISWFAGHRELIGGDGIHPTDAGHRFIAQRLEGELRSRHFVVPAAAY
jgi:lysophospholipase L1-like esterase